MSPSRTPIASLAAAALALGGLVALPASPAQADAQPTQHGTVLTFTGDPGAATASAVATSSCDVNDDGYDDAVFGAWWWSKGSLSRIGAAYVALGSARAAGGRLANPEDAGAVRIDGPGRANALIGFSVSCAGDVNGDGYDDIIIGDYINTSAYVIFGAEHFEPVTLDNLGERGFTVKGPTGDTRFGYSVKNVGDVTGDGLDDFAVGSSSGNKVYVIPGKADIDNIDLGADPGRVAITVAGKTGESLSVVSSVGDVNGDGVDDLLFGAYVSTPWGSSVAVPGAAYVVWGGRTGTVQTGDLSGSGFAIHGPTRQRDRLGVSVAAAGDVNGDGRADLLLGADGVTNAATGPRNGGAAIVYGSSSGATVYTNPVGTTSVYTCDDAGVDASSGACLGTASARGYWINGAAASDSTGYSVAGIGDVNGDGVPDALVGAYGYDPLDPGTSAPMSGAGAAYVLYGDPDRTAPLELATLSAAQGYRIDGGAAGDRFGRNVGSAGDFDGNGVNDLIVGADFAESQAGQASVVLQGALATETELTLPDGLKVGETSTLTAAVARLTAGGTPVTDGTVAFTDGGETVSGCEAVAPDEDGIAACDYRPAAGGAHAFAAAFTPGTLVTASHDEAEAEVAKLDPELALGGDTGGIAGDAVEFTASLAEGATGEVVFFADGARLGSAPVSHSVARFAYTPPKASSFRLTAEYSGDAAYEEATAKARRVTIDAAPVYLSAIEMSALKTVYGVRPTASVAVQGATSGVVLFTAGSRDLGTAEVGADGVARLKLPTLPVGGYRVSAQFLGDDARADSAKRTSASLLVVGKASVTSAKVTTKTARKHSRPTVTVRFGKLNNGAYPSGKVVVTFGSTSKTVTLRSSAKGVLKVASPKRLTSSVTVRVTYLGNANVAAKSAKATQRIRT